MRFILSVILISVVGYANATNYYFSSSSGDDSRSASQAKSSSTPWKSISKLNSIFSTLQPGDAVLFKRGDTFYGSITIKKSGTSSSPIVLGAYGSGSKPIITSLITLGSWVSKGSGIYESGTTGFTLSAVNMVLMNGSEQPMGRYPNLTTSGNKGYLTYESHSGKTSITDKEFTSTVNWAGAELVIRSRRWIIDRNTVKSNSGSTITYSTTSLYEPYDGEGYFIQDHIKTLDKLGEWYYNPSTKKISFYFGSQSTGAYKIQASAIDNLITVDGFSYISIDNLNIKGSNLYGVCIKGGSYVKVTNCDIEYSGRDGVYVNGHDYFKIENSTVSNSNCNGINLNYSGDHATVRNNKVTNTSLFPGLGTSGEGKGIGINTFGDGNIIEYNEIKKTGYTGIYFNGNNVTIKNNFLDSFCMTKDDGAGIYTWQGDAPSFKNRKVIGNIIINGVGAPAGSNNGGYLPVEGIYFDRGASYIDCSNNTIAGCGNNGIYLHNSYQITLRNNTFYNNSHQLHAVQKEGDVPIRNNVISNNLFISKQPDQLASYLKSSGNDIKLFAKMDSNFYVRPLDDRLVIFNVYPKSTTSSTTISQNFYLETWQDKYDKDLASKKAAKQVAPFKLNKLLSSNKFPSGNFSSTISGILKSSCSAAWGNDGKMDGGYLAISPTSRNSTVYFNVGSLTAGKKYILRFSVKSSTDSTMAIKAFLRQNVSPYRNLTISQQRPVSTSKNNYEILLISPSTESAGSVVFQVDDQTKYYLDNIAFYDADASVTNIDDSLKFVYNASKSVKSFTLDGNYIDVKNKSYSGSINLDPYTSAILIKKSSGTTTTSSPVVSLTSPVANSVYVTGSSVKIAATATDADGIQKVEFYQGSTKLTTELSAPYEWTWDNVKSGTYSITAKAYDNKGYATTSKAVAIIVGSAGAPIVALISPKANATYTKGTDVLLTATASDPDGYITKVQFYNSSSLINTQNSAPYSWTWSNLPSGTYSITAKAYDNKGNVATTAPIKITVGTSTLLSAAISSSVTSTDLLSMSQDNSMMNSTSFSKAQPLQPAMDFKISPNPAVSSFNLSVFGEKSESNATLNIYSNTGFLVKRMILNINNAEKVNISTLTPGTYIIELVTKSKSIRHNLVKMD